MTINTPNKVPYLQVQKYFPAEIEGLSQTIDKTYIEIASAVNKRTIGIFPSNKPVVTGNSYYITRARNQSFRQIYTFTTTNPIDLGFDTKYIPYFVSMYGAYTDNPTSTNWYGLIAGSNVAIAGQVSFYIAGTPTNQITFLVGAGSPVLTKGIIVLEWLSQRSNVTEIE
jgi:hypothetical protein